MAVMWSMKLFKADANKVYADLEQIEEKTPLLVHLNRFVGWSADIQISYIDSVYSAEQLLNVINLAGFGIGIGSGRRSCGYGRYHVEGIK